MTDISISGEVLQRKVDAYLKGVDAAMPNDIRLSAKRTAFYAMEYTLPVSTSGNAWPMAAMRGRIETDVKRAFPTKEDPRWASSAFDLIKDAHGEQRAKRWWYEHNHPLLGPEPESGRSASRLTAEEQFDRMRKIKRRVDPKAYAALRNRDGRIKLPRDTKPLAFANAAARGRLMRERKETAGLAKTGWYAVSQALGGQQNYTKAANEAGRFVWPKECRKIMNKFGGGIGRGSVTYSSGRGEFSIVNAVRYIDYAFPDNLRDLAISNAKNAMRIVFELRFKNRKNLEIAAA